MLDRHQGRENGRIKEQDQQAGNIQRDGFRHPQNQGQDKNPGTDTGGESSRQGRDGQGRDRAHGQNQDAETFPGKFHRCSEKVKIVCTCSAFCSVGSYHPCQGTRKPTHGVRLAHPCARIPLSWMVQTHLLGFIWFLPPHANFYYQCKR